MILIGILTDSSIDFQKSIRFPSSIELFFQTNEKALKKPQNMNQKNSLFYKSYKTRTSVTYHKLR